MRETLVLGIQVIVLIISCTTIGYLMGVEKEREKRKSITKSSDEWRCIAEVLHDEIHTSREAVKMALTLLEQEKKGYPGGEHWINEK